MIGEGDEDRFEHRALLGGRATLGDQPVGQLSERDLADQLARQVVSEEQDAIGIGGAEARAKRRRTAHVGAAASQSRISSLCSPSSGGGRW